MGERQRLRDEMRLVLGNLDRRWGNAASMQLSERLEEVVEGQLGKHAEHLLSFMPRFPGEPDLTSFITHQMSERLVYLPRVLPDHSLKFVQIGQDWSASDNRVGDELAEGDSLETGKIYPPAYGATTVVLVPGLAFDFFGNRLSRGGAHYDEFLQQASMHKAIKIGVCWQFQLLPLVPVSSTGLTMDWLCHERGWSKVELGESET
jgi:5-formyltetrahydrofolate cyclo-ligase